MPEAGRFTLSLPPQRQLGAHSEPTWQISPCGPLVVGTFLSQLRFVAGPVAFAYVCTALARQKA